MGRAGSEDNDRNFHVFRVFRFGETVRLSENSIGVLRQGRANGQGVDWGVLILFVVTLVEPSTEFFYSLPFEILEGMYRKIELFGTVT